MPRLGTAGKDLAELDIEMNHNSVDVEVCKKGNMEAGKSYNLLQYLQADDEILEKMMQLRNISHFGARWRYDLWLWWSCGLLKVNVLENYATLLGDMNKYKYAIPVNCRHTTCKSRE